jgi:hypothetical protein
MSLSFKWILLFYIMMVQASMVAQQLEATDKKGNIINVNNNRVTTDINAPSEPLENDVWLDTSDNQSIKPKIWNGAIWVSLDYTGTPGSVFYTGSDGLPTQNNDNFYWNTITSRLGIGTNSPQARLDVDGGTVRFSDYGSGSITGIATNILAVEADGDIIEIDTSSLGIDNQTAAEVSITDTANNFTSENVEGALLELATVSSFNIYTANGTLTSSRTVTQNNFDLNFDANTLVVSGSSSRVGIGTITPNAKLDIEGGSVRFSDYGGGTIVGNVSSFLAVEADGDVIETNETKTSIAQNTATGVVTHSSEDASSQSVNIISANANNNITVGTDGGAYYNSPTKAYGKLIPATSSIVSVGLSAASKNAVGRYTFTMATARSSANYPIQLTVLETGTNTINIYVTAQTTTTFSIAIVQNMFGSVSYIDKTCYFTVLDF